MVSPNQDPQDSYELPTPKHWHIMHRIHGLKYELLHEFLYYIRVHRSWRVRSLNIAKAIQKMTLNDTRTRIEPQDVKSSAALQSSGPQLTSQSTGGSPLGHTNLPQHPQYSGIFATKRSTSKTWATKAQQDWPINLAINSRLLACKASGEGPILMPNTHYEWVLLSNFCSNQTFRRKVHPTLIIPKLQAIK
jgi:hypothetical protein